jgi:predicted MPP superfamily phosphohydrolase
MLLFLKILILLWAVNLAPPLLTCFLGEKWSTSLDRGRLFIDGKPLFGSHKTERGIAGGIVTGLLLGKVLGFPFWVGFLVGTLSMSGDLVSSFLKRRFAKPSGSLVPGLDQIFEGLFPFLVLGPTYSLPGMYIFLLVILFSIGALGGSLFLKRILLGKPFEHYSRPLSPRTRFREWRACRTIKNPLHLFLNFEQTVYYHVFMKTVFRLLGLYERGMHNALQVEQSNLTFYFEDLPHHFDNYTILFLSDLHLDGLDGMTEKLQEIVKDLPVDLCILGGDYRTNVYGSFAKTLLRLNRLVRKIHAEDGIFAVVGNHDCLEMVPIMEKRGINFLINDATVIERNGERIWFAGVDEPHYYQSHDLEETFKNVPDNGFKIFIAHGPKLYREVVKYAPQLYLCGHTHAGQIQFPLIGPLYTNSNTPRRFALGKWEYKGVIGYTSRGASVSGIPVRFGCRGEVVHITLKKRTLLPE